MNCAFVSEKLLCRTVATTIFKHSYSHFSTPLPLSCLLCGFRMDDNSGPDYSKEQHPPREVSIQIQVQYRSIATHNVPYHCACLYFPIISFEHMQHCVVDGWKDHGGQNLHVKEHAVVHFFQDVLCQHKGRLSLIFTNRVATDLECI